MKNLEKMNVEDLERISLEIEAEIYARQSQRYAELGIIPGYKSAADLDADREWDELESWENEV